jgi:hypothetical protein
MITRLQLASHRAHWIEVTRNTKTDQSEYHKKLMGALGINSESALLPNVEMKRL